VKPPAKKKPKSKASSSNSGLVGFGGLGGGIKMASWASLAVQFSNKVKDENEED
jgi:hypothetical protein